ncbi:MAG: hypothetical protein FWD61_02775 [Phycisphaerales bacterium]|nr:hypothetical protein [Phycisphaerales bacterium]
MSSVIKKKRQSLFARIFKKLGGGSSPREEESVGCRIPSDEVRTDTEDAAAIAARRRELKTVKHGNTDAVVHFTGKNKNT